MSTPKPLNVAMPLRLDMNEQIECAFTLVYPERLLRGASAQASAKFSLQLKVRP